MAVSGSSQLSSFDGTTRLLGLSNSTFNTTDLVDAEIQLLELQISPQKNQRANLAQEKTIWESFRNDFLKLTNTFQDMRLYSASQKTATYSKEGVVSFKTTASAVEATYDMKVTKLADRHQIAGKDMLSTDTALNLTDDVIKVNGKDVSITSSMTLRDVVNAINATGTGASASIISNRLVLTSKSTGEANAMTLADGTNGTLKSLGVLNADGSFANVLKTASDAEYSINGLSLRSSTNEIKNVIDGVTFTLNGISTDSTRVEVKQSNEEIVNKIEEMVKAYNTGILSFNKYTDKETYLQGQGLPLALRRSLSNISSFVSTQNNYLYQFGIEMDKANPKDGTIVFNKEKLEKMLNENPEAVQKMFFGEDGLGKYMKDKLDVYTGETGSLKGKIDGLTKSIKSMDDSIAKFEVFQENQKQTILNKYAAFETMLAGLNSQLDYVTAQMKSLSGSSD